ncbi:transglycosylase SLT domain-containing protein [Halalkalibaculum sp. DA384]|uniref:transglycosylase SLT domain-containing protein n=1 Tax=Halalkalibaculum sp. DA384 TaxID=3373606 RepID=UPI0037541F1F
MNAKPHEFSRNLLIPALVAVGITVSTCTQQQEEIVEQNIDQGLNVSVTEPVERDYEEIKNSGVLRMITNYSSNTYFLHQGIDRGFEYEMVREFANEHDLALEVVIVGPNQNPYDLLNSGAGDLIAANYTITPERKQYVKFTRPYNLVNQLIIFSDDIENPPSTLEALAERNIPITVRRNSSYYSRLQELQQNGYDLNIRLTSSDMDTESLLFEISRDEHQATVADNNMFQASGTYMNGLVKGPTIARNDTIAWAIRNNASDLETRLNRFLYKHFRFGAQEGQPKRSTFLNVLRKRYFGGGQAQQVASIYRPVSEIEGTGIISPYDDLIKSVADSAGVDWLMIASIIAQETKFNPNSKSWAGAVGLMQVMPQFSQVENEQLLYDAEINLREGVRIITEHLRHYSYLDSLNQWALALATYNAGPGHVADARRLTIDHNKNPNEWENVSDALLKLMQRKYYKDARFGFCRGIETVRYVKEVMNRHQTYETILAMAERKNLNQQLGMVNTIQ